MVCVATGARDSFPLKSPDRLRAHSAYYLTDTGALFRRLKLPEREAGHWPTSSEERNEWRCASTPVCLLGVYRNNFSLRLPVFLFPKVLVSWTQTVGIVWCSVTLICTTLSAFLRKEDACILLLLFCCRREMNGMTAKKPPMRSMNCSPI